MVKLRDLSEAAELLPPDQQSLLEDSDAGWLLADEGELVAAFGVKLFPWKTAGEVWFVRGDAAERHAFETITAVSAALDREMERMGLWVVQAHVAEENKQAVRFASWLGLNYAGTLPRFGPHGENMVLMCKERADG